jgi:outer membrane lipoprotein-sorting protein
MTRHVLSAALAALTALPLPAADPLADALAKIDQAAARFKALSADVRYVQHMDIIHEDDEQTGAILVKRPHPKELHVKMSIEKPEKKVAVTDGTKVDVYYANTGQKQTVNLDRHRRSLVDLILTLGFGGGSKELQSAYAVKYGAPETVAGESATRLELTPKSADMLGQWTKIDLWISDKTGNTVQQKFYEHGKDYTLITYTNVVANPDIPDSALKLDVPKGTQREVLNKK